MSDPEGTVALVNDARALLDTFVQSGWESAIVRVGTREFTYSRCAGQGGLGVKSTVDGGENHSIPLAGTEWVCAPHVGTVVGLAQVGSAVAKGDHLASLSVLEEVIDVPASAGGMVLAHSVKPGMLVEYGQRLIELAS